MSRFARMSLLLVVMLMSLGVAKDNTPLQIYVRNQPFLGSVYVNPNKKIYVELESFLSALAASYGKVGESYWIGSNPSNIAGKKSRIYIKGVPFYSCLTLRGKLYVKIDIFAKQLGAAFLYNRATQVVDIIYLHPLPSGSSADEKKNEEGAFSGTPLSVTLENADLDYRPQSSSYYPAARIYVFAKNIANTTLEQATLRCDFVDLNGKIFTQDTQIISNLEKQQQKEVIFFWSNSATPAAIGYKVYLLNWKFVRGELQENPTKENPILQNG